VFDATLTTVRESHTPHDVIRVTTHGVRVDNERYHDIIQVLKTAAAIDDSATSILVRSDWLYREALGDGVPYIRSGYGAGSKWYLRAQRTGRAAFVEGLSAIR